MKHKLPHHASHYITVVAIVVVLGVEIAIGIEVHVVCVATRVHHGRPIVAVGSHVVNISIGIAPARSGQNKSRHRD